MPEREWLISMHARQRAEEMGVPISDVLAVVRDPEVDYPQPRRGDHARLAQRGALAVAYDDAARVIVTVLWRNVERWERS